MPLLVAALPASRAAAARPCLANQSVEEDLEIAKCHQDALLGNDRGPLLKYCATYTPKFSDAFHKEWLADEASAFSVARGAFRLQALRAGDVAVSCGQEFPALSLQRNYGGAAGALARPKIVQLYQESAWRREDMSLLEFARKTNKKRESSSQSFGLLRS